MSKRKSKKKINENAGNLLDSFCTKPLFVWDCVKYRMKDGKWEKYVRSNGKWVAVKMK